MSSVKIKVGPKTYSIACGPGEEEKVARLGALINEHYSKLGNSRAALEAENVVFAALFMADELDEALSAAREAKADLVDAKQELQRAQDDAANALRKAVADSEQEQEKSGSKQAELRAEIETLRKAEERARKETAQLKIELATLQEQARHQHDLFGGPAEDAAHSKALAEKLEALATRAEAAASELEARARPH